MFSNHLCTPTCFKCIQDFVAKIKYDEELVGGKSGGSLEAREGFGIGKAE